MRGGLDVAVRPPDPAGVEGVARRILAEHQFRQPGKSLVTRFIDWLANELSRLLPGGGGQGIAVPSWVAVVILLALVAVVVVVVVRSGLFRARGKGRRVDDAPTVHETVEDLAVASEVWLARAAAAEGVDDWREGVRCRYRATLAVLAASGVVAERVGRTAGSYRRRVDEALPAGASAFAEATGHFEDAWYGPELVGPAVSAAMETAHAQVAVAASESRAAGGSGEAGETGEASDGDLAATGSSADGSSAARTP